MGFFYAHKIFHFNKSFECVIISTISFQASVIFAETLRSLSFGVVWDNEADIVVRLSESEEEKQNGVQD